MSIKTAREWRLIGRCVTRVRNFTVFTPPQVKAHKFAAPSKKLVKVHPKNFVDLASSTPGAASGKVDLLARQHCDSCGVPLQKQNPHEIGYFEPSVLQPKPKPAVKEIDKNYVQMLNSLSEEERLLLVNESTDFAEPKLFVPFTRNMGHEPKPKVFKSEIEEPEQLHRRLNCLRCHQLLHFNSYDKAQHGSVELHNLLRDIPASAHVVYVLTARDFPLGIDHEVFKYVKPGKIHFVVNKIDHLYDDLKQPFKLGAKFYRSYLHKKLGADPSKVYLVSAKHHWGSKQLMYNLPPNGDIYVIGEVNSGKSSLIRALLYLDNVKLTKNGNYGPGVSSFPSFTRDKMVFPLQTRGSNCRIVDVPGFTTLNPTLYRHLDAEQLKQLHEKPVFISPKEVARGAKVVTRFNRLGKYNGSRVMTIGGFFFLKPPAGTVAKFRVVMPGQGHVFKDIEKAQQIFRDTRPRAVNHLFNLDREAYNELTHYVVPPFLGSIDLVVGGVGFVTISPTSNKKSVPKNELFEVWVPKGIKVCVREPLVKYVYKTKTHFDKDGNLLEKHEVAEKGTVELRDVPEDKAIVSRLFEVPKEVQKAAEVFADEFYRGDHSKIELIDPEVKTAEEYPNFYWEEPR